MKKIVIIALSFLAVKGYSNNDKVTLTSVPTYTYIVRNGGGLFGYKYVDSTSGSNGSGGTNQTLTCSKPGTTKCLWKNAALAVSDLSEDELTKVESIVYEKIQTSKESNQKGNFVFNTNYLVTYEFNLNADKLEYKILTREEAKELGFNL